MSCIMTEAGRLCLSMKHLAVAALQSLLGCDEKRKASINYNAVKEWATCFLKLECDVLLEQYEVEYEHQNTGTDSSNITNQLVTVICAYILRDNITHDPLNQEVLGRLIPRDPRSASFDLSNPRGLNAYLASLKLRAWLKPDLCIQMLPLSSWEYCRMDQLFPDVDGLDIVKAHRDLMLMYKREYSAILEEGITFDDQAMIEFSLFIKKFIGLDHGTFIPEIAQILTESDEISDAILASVRAYYANKASPQSRQVYFDAIAE